MNKKIRRISPVSCGKMLAAFYAFIALIFVLIGIVAFIAPSKESTVLGTETFFLEGILILILVPIVYIVIGFIFGIILAAIYNLCAKWVGGIEITLED